MNASGLLAPSQLVRLKKFRGEPVGVSLRPLMLSVDGFASQVMIELVDYDEGVS